MVQRNQLDFSRGYACLFQHHGSGTDKRNLNRCPYYGQRLKVDPSYLDALKWRSIGLHRGGRVVAVVGHPTDPMAFYFGATGGGVWKTIDGGQSWKNISDGFFQTGSVGAIDIAASDPNVIYVGMGESPIRGDVSHGDGVYKSTDGGATWRNVGLKDTRQIARVRIHPKNPNLVYVAALGHVFGPSGEGYVRMTCVKSWEDLKKGLAQIRKGLL